jgi:hypothetical protein
MVSVIQTHSALCNSDTLCSLWYGNWIFVCYLH